jgi:hypothetical protein
MHSITDSVLPGEGNLLNLSSVKVVERISELPPVFKTSEMTIAPYLYNDEIYLHIEKLDASLVTEENVKDAREILKFVAMEVQGNA